MLITKASATAYLAFMKLAVVATEATCELHQVLIYTFLLCPFYPHASLK